MILKGIRNVFVISVTTLCREYLKVRVHTEDKGIDGRITRTLILKKEDERLESSGSEHRPVGGD
jgi:hypothetical protein